MIIRKATLTDVPHIMAIIKKAVPLMRASGNFQWSDDYPNTEVFEQDIQLDQLWVADLDGNIAGATAITTEQYPDYTQCGWDINDPAIVTHRLCVDPGYRGQGIAEALLMEAEHEANRRGIPLLRIDTNSQNKAANKLFPKLGYIYAGDITLQFRPGLSFCCYQKQLQ